MPQVLYGPLTPAAFHFFISMCIGGGIPMLARANKGAGLIILIAIWVAFHVFMHARARRARGVFIDEEVELFSLFGAIGFLIGLLMVSTLCLVFT